MLTTVTILATQLVQHGSDQLHSLRHKADPLLELTIILPPLQLTYYRLSKLFWNLRQPQGDGGGFEEETFNNQGWSL